MNSRHAPALNSLEWEGARQLIANKLCRRAQVSTWKEQAWQEVSGVLWPARREVLEVAEGEPAASFAPCREGRLARCAARVFEQKKGLNLPRLTRLQYTKRAPIFSTA